MKESNYEKIKSNVEKLGYKLSPIMFTHKNGNLLTNSKNEITAKAVEYYGNPFKRKCTVHIKYE